MAKKIKNKRTNNDVQNTAQEPKDWATLKQGVSSGALEGLTVPALHLTPVMLIFSDKNII